MDRMHCITLDIADGGVEGGAEARRRGGASTPTRQCRQLPVHNGARSHGFVHRPRPSPYNFLIMSNYDQLHRQCRTLENLFDSKLTSYSQLVSNISRPGQDIEASGSSERWRDLELELDDLSIKVSNLFSTFRCSFSEGFRIVGRNQ